MNVSLERKRTTWDIVLGILLLLGGLWLLANVVFATAFLVLAIAWTTLIGGVLMLISALVNIRSSGVAWSTLIGGVLLTVLGIFMLRNMGAAALALTMMAGALFFASGLVRIGLATTMPRRKWVFVVSGLISIALGVWVLLNPITATLTVLGVLFAVQILSEGITLLVAGRLHIVPDRTDDPAKAPTP